MRGAAARDLVAADPMRRFVNHRTGRIGRSWIGVKAVLALSPYTEPFLVHGTLGGVSAPVMYQGGTLDFGITPSIEKSGGVYDATPSPRYFVDFARAGHLAWTDLRDAMHDEINGYAIAFLDHYVLGIPASAALTQETSGVRYDSELGHGSSGAAGDGRRGRARP